MWTVVGDLRRRRLIHDFKLLKNRVTPEKSKLARFHALIIFRDEARFSRPFSEVAAMGIHAGKHGFMIENVSQFVIEVFEERPQPSEEPG